MKLFFAGADSGRFADIAQLNGAGNFLCSFFYSKDSTVIRRLKEVNKDCCIFLDSGGYSARKNGVEVNIDNYKSFLDRYKDYLFTAANLDVDDLDTQLENQKTLEEAFPVLPVYHYKEYAEGNTQLFLDYCEKYPYVAIGGVAGVGVPKDAEVNFFNFVFKIAVPKKIKLHGFGITKMSSLKAYPFYSCDSTSWLSGGMFGTMKVWNSQKFEFFPDIHYSEKEGMLKYNVNIDATTDYEERLTHNVKEFLKMEADITRLWESRGIKYE
jgi:hypothetical protein